MSIIKINSKNYEVPELNFAHSKILEKCGVPLRRMLDADLVFTLVSAFVVIVVGCDAETADFLVEQHVLGGGSIQDIYGAYTKALGDSHFFKKLLGLEETKQTGAKAIKEVK